MNYQFSNREKILLVILSILIIFIGYFKFILEPINNEVTELEAKTAKEEVELTNLIVKKAEYDKMVKELEELRNDPDKEEIPDYDNSKALLFELYEVLDDASYYSVSPSATSKIDYIFVRPMSISFETATYEDARKIIDNIDQTKILKQISDVSISQSRYGNKYTTNLLITYYELMK